MSIVSTDKERTPTETEALDRLRFASIIPWILEHEGGYVNDPQDPGGETNFGISKRTYPRENIRALTIDRAAAIYYVDWWVRHKIHRLEDDGVAAKALDTCINVGPKTGIKLLQMAIKRCDKAVSIDGYIGPETAGAANKCDPVVLVNNLAELLAAYYVSKVNEKPEKKKYLKGWLRRAQSKYEGGKA